MGQYVGIDLHCRSTTIHRMAEDGQTLAVERIASQPFELAQAMADAGPEPEVVLESTYGWYWGADVLKEQGAHVHLAHALGNNWGHRRVKNDKHDARDLALLLRIGRLSQGWIAPPEIRELRELVRYRYSLTRHRTSAKAQIHGVMAKNGILPVVGELWGPLGTAQLDGLELPEAYAWRLDSLRQLLAHHDREITRLDALVHHRLKDEPAYKALVRLPGVGKVLGAIFFAEIGDVSRFESAKKLCSWAGLTPKHKESDEMVRRGAITKQGSPLVRWACIEAVGNYRAKGNEKLRADYKRIAERRGKYKARTAVARKMLILVFYTLRDGEVHNLARTPQVA
jgi:transposase